MNKYKLIHQQIDIQLDRGVIGIQRTAANDPEYEPAEITPEDMMRCELHYACNHSDCKKHGCHYHLTRCKTGGRS